MSRITQAPQADVPDAESSVQGARHTELQSIREERDRLRCELVDIRAEPTDQRELQREMAQTRAHMANQDREIACLSAMLDPTREKACKFCSYNAFLHDRRVVPTFAGRPPAVFTSPRRDVLRPKAIHPGHPLCTTGESCQPSRTDHLRPSPFLHGKASRGLRADPPSKARLTNNNFFLTKSVTA
ncbi:hypothetical protein CRG98_043667 [Punica granatum]|uniref:Uncharacterized protein n=1 Tax=Punica granatum TaxID=22663 RepID=A0A2I0HW80_PUNGR|nr:hypothetical protein CRG98_043667 [Punica granatum]